MYTDISSIGEHYRRSRVARRRKFQMAELEPEVVFSPLELHINRNRYMITANRR